jgi:hypothetical protein
LTWHIIAKNLRVFRALSSEQCLAVVLHQSRCVRSEDNIVATVEDHPLPVVGSIAQEMRPALSFGNAPEFV